MHGGHTDRIADFSWNKNDPWLICSAAEDNMIQIWKASKKITHRDDRDIPLEEVENQKSAWDAYKLDFDSA